MRKGIKVVFILIVLAGVISLGIKILNNNKTKSKSEEKKPLTTEEKVTDIVKDVVKNQNQDEMNKVVIGKPIENKSDGTYKVEMKNKVTQKLVSYYIVNPKTGVATLVIPHTSGTCTTGNCNQP